MDTPERELLRGFEAENAIRQHLGELISLVKSGCGNWKYRFEEIDGVKYFDFLAAEYEAKGDGCLNDMRENFMVQMVQVLRSLRDLGVDFLRDHENERTCEEWNYGEWARFTKGLYERLDELYSGRVGSQQIPFRYVGSPYVRWDFPKRNGQGPSLLPGVSQVLPNFDVESLAVDSRWKITQAAGLWPSRRTEPDQDNYPQRIQREVLPGLERYFFDSSTVEAEALLQEGKGLAGDISEYISGKGYFADQYGHYRDFFFSRVRGLQRDRERMFGKIVDAKGEFRDPSQVAHRVQDVLREFHLGWRGVDRGFPEVESDGDWKIVFYSALCYGVEA